MTLRRLLAALFVVILLAGVVLAIWARAVFTKDTVREALAAQLSSALGQPVSVATISAKIYPRVTVTLGGVAIGQPAGVQIDTLDVGTDFRALLSRRIEHATVRVEGAKIQLPLIPLGHATSTSNAQSSSSTELPVELVSIDEVVLSDVELISAGRTLRGDIEVIPDSVRSFEVKRMSLAADDASIEAKGRITDLRGPAGELTLSAGQLNLDRLLAFFSDFTGGATSGSSRGTSGGWKPDLNVSIQAARAQFAGITLDALKGHVHVTESGVMLKPLAFGLFAGKYDGAIAYDARAGRTPSFSISGAMSGIDFPAVTRFAGSQSDPITGRLSAKFELTGSGADAATAMRGMRGPARVQIENGIVRNLGLVRAVVVATSMRGASATIAGAGAAASAEAQSRDEPFKRLGATIAVAGQTATTSDLTLEGQDVSMAAQGSFAMNGRQVRLGGRVQLSDALTARAGTDLVRFTREGGRVTLPVTVTGPAEALSVQIDAAQLLQRAIRNAAEDQIKKTITKGLEGLFKKPKD